MDVSTPARSFRDLIVWEKAHRFVLAVYPYTAAFPKQETYGLSTDAARGGLHPGKTLPKDSAGAGEPTKSVS